ncbi:arylsulfatase [Candidatus Epulonipiscioides gigas]|nr:arylsulfatase [Epulopiscium sp. SCG-C07WGA-EpuloA2]
MIRRIFLKKPNVIIIYADDLGYGDLSCYGAEDINTPNIDNLLENGIKFTNAYSTSAVCTPARYSIITGEYPFRNEYTKILPGNAKCIIDTDVYTLPKMFKTAGYNTAVIGKWHLGLSDGDINWNGQITKTPNDLGFDYSFIFPGTNDRVPLVYIKNRQIYNLDPNDPIEVCYQMKCPFENEIDTYENSPEKIVMESSMGHNRSLINGIGRIGFMRGGKSAIWKDDELSETFLGEVKNFIDEKRDKPFFIYYALHQPHVPRVPSARFKGATALGPRGDVIVELDWCIGELTSYLRENNLLDDTIIIFSSDNGPVLNDGYDDKAYELNKNHRPAGPLRGGKYSKFDGGARVPFILSWSNNISKAESPALLSQVDLMNSFANMLDISLDKYDAKDSQNMIDVLLGKTIVGRPSLVFESGKKIRILRRGKWAYLQPSEGEEIIPIVLNETGNSLNDQLYNMDYDISQRINVADQYPQIVESMKQELEQILQSTHTRKKSI